MTVQRISPAPGGVGPSLTVARALVGLVLLFVVLPFVAAERVAATPGPVECSAPAGRLAVAVVVTFGDGAEPQVRCANVANGASGFDALRAAGFTLRIESGFLCAIDAVPAVGCATGAGFDGTYWRYFRAQPGGSWLYATTGGGYPISAVGGCAVEGWSWSGAATVVPPAVQPKTISCSHSPATTSAPTTTAPAGPVVTAPAVTAPAGSAPPPASPSRPAPGTGGPAPGIGPAGPVSSGAADPGATPGTSDAPGTGDPSGQSTTEVAAPDSTVVAAPEVAPAQPLGPGRTETAAAGGKGARTGSHSTGSPRGLLATLGLVVLILAAAVKANRRRLARPVEE